MAIVWMSFDFVPAFDAGHKRRDKPLYIQIANLTQKAALDAGPFATELLAAAADFAKAAEMMNLDGHGSEQELFALLAPYLAHVRPRLGGGWQATNLVAAAATMLTIDVGHAKAARCPCCGELFRRIDSRAEYCSQACQVLTFQRANRDEQRRKRREARPGRGRGRPRKA